MVFEFVLLKDYKSPNRRTKNNEVVFKELKKDDIFVAELSEQKMGNGGKIVINKGGWMVPLAYLKRANNNKWSSFEEYNSKNNTIKKEDLPPEVIKKVNEVANKNLAKNLTINASKNMKYAMLSAGIGVAYALIAKKSPYVCGIAGFIVGIAIVHMKGGSSTESKTTETKTEEAK